MESNILFPDLENRVFVNDEIKLYLYADEIKKFSNLNGESWMYIGLVIITEDEKNELFHCLMRARKDANYSRELHFRDINRLSERSEKTQLCKKWIEITLSENRPRLVNFHILGLNLSNLQHQAFGEKKGQARNIYNRFFRSTTSNCLKYYFAKYKKITVKTIFHDRNELENDELFDWHTIWRIETEEEKISFDNRNICFIDSDHLKEKDFPNESHFIQLTDIILGAASLCLDKTNNREGSNEIAQMFLPLIERLNDNRRANNPNSKYNYFRKCGLSFFPKKRLTLEQLKDRWERTRSGFYKNRPIILREKMSGQENLFQKVRRI
ncbi:DUF3800 domain-containing protein [candidate division WOR-3 bacterium]|nr:DUF3800 domain-containing protein [candidate division WOR-3 bacterium]